MHLNFTRFSTLFLLIAAVLFFSNPASAQQNGDLDFYGNPAKSGKKKMRKKKKRKKKDEYDPYEFLYQNIDGDDPTSKSLDDKVEVEDFQSVPVEPAPPVQPVETTNTTSPNTSPNTSPSPSPTTEQYTYEQSGEVINMNVDDLFQGQLEEVVVSTPRKELSFHEAENVKYLYSQALQKIDGKSYESAIKLLNKSLKKDPNSKELLQIRANAYAEVGEFRKAISDFKKVLVIAPDDAVANYNAASAYAKIGKFKDAVRLYTAAINYKADYLLAYQGRAAARTMLKEYSSSIDDYNTAIEMNSFFTPAYRGRGVANSLMGYNDQAIMDFTHTLDLMPEDGLSYYYRGLAFSKNRDLTAACDDFIEAYRRNIKEASYELKDLCNYGNLD